MKPGLNFLNELKSKYPNRNIGYGTAFQIGQAAVILVYDENDGKGQYVDLCSIIADEKGNGAGSRTLQILLQHADKHSVSITLYARAMDGKISSTDRCIKWYTRHGFKIEGKRGKWIPDPKLNEEDHVGADMTRDPQKAA